MVVLAAQQRTACMPGLGGRLCTGVAWARTHQAAAHAAPGPPHLMRPADKKGNVGLWHVNEGSFALPAAARRAQPILRPRQAAAEGQEEGGPPEEGEAGKTGGGRLLCAAACAMHEGLLPQCLQPALLNSAGNSACPLQPPPRRRCRWMALPAALRGPAVAAQGRRRRADLMACCCCSRSTTRCAQAAWSIEWWQQQGGTGAPALLTVGAALSARHLVHLARLLLSGRLQYICGLRWAGGAGRSAALFTASYDGSLRRLDAERGVSGGWMRGPAGGGSAAASCLLPPRRRCRRRLPAAGETCTR